MNNKGLFVISVMHLMIICFFFCFNRKKEIVFKNSIVEHQKNIENYIHCPIKFQDRVKNHTGTQCVWSSIETLGRWCGQYNLYNPPITERPECKSYASPIQTAKVLSDLNIPFSHSFNDKVNGINLIKRSMQERRGCLFGVYSHTLILVHYDESDNVAKFIDTSDENLEIQSISIQQFHQIWDSWILLIEGGDDLIKEKTMLLF